MTPQKGLAAEVGLYLGGEGVLEGNIQRATRRRASERSERAYLAAPPERALLPKGTPSPPCGDKLQPPTLSIGQLRSVARDHVRVISPARFDRSRLSRVIDVNNAETFGIPERPFVIVEKR